MKIFDKQWALTLLLIPFFKPEVLEYIPNLSWLEKTFNVLRIMALVVVVFEYFRDNALSKPILTIIVYELVLFFSTMLNNGNYWKLAVNCGVVISFCMLIELGIKRNFNVFIRAFFDFSLFVVMLNLILLAFFSSGITLYPGTFDRINLYGGDNILPPLMIPFMAIAVMYGEYMKNSGKLKSVLLIISVSVTILATWSATGVVGWFVFILYFALIYRKKISRSVNAVFLGIVYVSSFFALVVFRLQNYFSFIVEDILHKSITLTGRIQIWDYVYYMIKRSPVIGYGVYDNLIYLRNQYFSHAHNGVLEILLQSGILGLGIFIVVFAMSCYRLYKFRDHYISGIVTAGLFSFMVLLLAEGYINHMWLFGLMVISGRISDIVNEFEKKGDISEKDENIPLRSRYIYYRLRKR